MALQVAIGPIVFWLQNCMLLSLVMHMTLLQLLDLLAFSLVSFEEKLAATKFSLTDMFIFMQIV